MNGPYILACWLIVFVTLAVYAGATLARGRRLARRVPAGERRWSESSDGGAQPYGGEPS
jgi:hypothetical protein